MKKNINKIIALVLMAVLIMSLMMACGPSDSEGVSDDDAEVTIRICNWEEYIDEGDWDEDELIELENGVEILGENSMVDDFVDWYYETYGVKVNVEYSCFGTNEELYNQLTLGDEYDLICPSEYMFMKLIAEDKLEPLSEEFFNKDNEYNYYINGVSDYIWNIFDNHDINGEKWSKYAACFMWGTTGIVYNPEYITEEEASSWTLLANPEYDRKFTIKDNVRDAVFEAMAIYKSDLFLSDEFKNDENYVDNLFDEMNDNSEETLEAVEKILKDIKDIAYSFETDSGKADMVTGKVYANYQWSGDAVYSLDQAEEDDVYLNFSIPEEASNIYCDGWVMLKDGIDNDAAKKQACEAFINFVSRPDNAVRNMYYIGYTSSIAGGDDDTVFSYIDYMYAAEDDAEETIEYDLSYFFGEDSIIEADAEQAYRQLLAQYPTEDIIDRCAIMWYFNDDQNARINKLWINVRCFDMMKAVKPILYVLAVCAVVAGLVCIYVKRYSIFKIKKK